MRFQTAAALDTTAGPPGTRAVTDTSVVDLGVWKYAELWRVSPESPTRVYQGNASLPTVSGTGLRRMALTFKVGTGMAPDG